MDRLRAIARTVFSSASHLSLLLGAGAIKRLYYRDALTQMTDSACVEWMRKKDYLKRWLLPRAGLNDIIKRNDGKTSKDHGGRPSGNLLEVILV